MANEIPQYESRQHLSLGSEGSYSGAFESQAQASKQITEIGANLALKGSSAIAENMGRKDGLNPYGGNTLPAITSFDESYQKAYSQQAEMTLGMQANKLIHESQLEVSRAPKLTGELLTKFESNVTSGLDSIAKNAPENIRPELKFKMANAMENASFSLHNKLISQNIEDTKEAWKLSLEDGNENISQTTINGKIEVGKMLTESAKESNKTFREQGYISRTQERSANATADQTYLNGKYINSALKSDAEGNLSKWIDDFSTKKPSDMNNDQWQTASKAVSSYISGIVKKQNTNIKIAGSNFVAKATKDPTSISSTDIESLKDNTDTLTFNSSMNTYYNKLHRASKKDKATAYLSKNSNNPEIFATATAKEKNDVLSYLAGQIQTESTNSASMEPLNAFEARTQAINQISGEVPEYTSQLKGMVASGDPDSIDRASQAFDSIVSEPGGVRKVQGVANDLKTMSIMDIYNLNREVRQQSPEQAAANAIQAVDGSGEERRKAIENSWSKVLSNNRLKGESKEATTLGMLNYNPKLPVRNLPLLALKANKLLHASFVTNGGDIEAAKKTTSRALNDAYGRTNMNKEPEITYWPIEKKLGIGPDYKGVIHSDMAEQFNTQVLEMKKQYEQGRRDTWLETKGTINHEQIIKLKNYFENNEEGSVKELTKLKKYLKNGGLTVVQHRRGQEDVLYDVDLVSTGRLSERDDGTISGYEMMARTENGHRSFTIDNGLQSSIVYSPNKNEIEKKYNEVYAVSQNNTPKEVFKKTKEQIERKNESSDDAKAKFEESRKRILGKNKDSDLSNKKRKNSLGGSSAN